MIVLYYTMEFRFMGMSAYNVALPTDTFQDGAPTLKFVYDRPHTPCFLDSTYERVGVVILYKTKKI